MQNQLLMEVNRMNHEPLGRCPICGRNDLVATEKAVRTNGDTDIEWVCHCNGRWRLLKTARMLDR